MTRRIKSLVTALSLLALLVTSAAAQSLPRVTKVEHQPFAAQINRLLETLAYLGEPLRAADQRALELALSDADAARANAQIQDVLDRYCLFDIHINPESRVKVAAGPAKPELFADGWRTFLVKVRNEAGVTAPLVASSPNAQPVWARGPSANIPGGFSLDPRPAQTITPRDVMNRWLDLSLYTKPPQKPELTGLEVEYRIIQLYSRDAGKREARIGFNVGQGTQDIGFRNETDVLFTCLPATELTLRVQDENGRPTTASFIIRDAQGRTYPAKAKRLAPDFGFQPQIYRADGETLRLAAGDYTIEYTRGPEYLVKRQSVKVSGRAQTVSFKLERWINPAQTGWYSGDHHIHAAGCSHYETPTEGVLPQDMIRHILGEALGVGSVLTWGPCYYFQKQFFEGKENQLSTPENVMRYDVEVSGFPSSHAGHLALLRLKDQDYPGTKTLEDWPTWTLPILQWAKRQGAVVGFAHSGWGLQVSATELPNYEMPKFDGIGANEYIVDVTHDAVDFISTVDTPAVWELNIWYHTLNSGFRTRISGETDFPCIYGERVGLGRSYVKLDEKLSYDAWVEGIRAGRAYVSDGKSHLMDFGVNGVQMGTNASEVKLTKPQTVRVTARVAARLDEQPNAAIQARKWTETPYWELERARVGASREVPVELIVNGQAVAKKMIIADGALRDIAFDAPLTQSSWVALRILPSSHTNPVFVTINDEPIRASRRSAEWCLKAVDQCWSQKAPKFSDKELGDAEKAYEHARQVYRRIISESRTD